jgi:hypothetical protein
VITKEKIKAGAYQYITEDGHVFVAERQPNKSFLSRTWMVTNQETAKHFYAQDLDGVARRILQMHPPEKLQRFRSDVEDLPDDGNREENARTLAKEYFGDDSVYGITHQVIDNARTADDNWKRRKNYLEEREQASGLYTEANVELTPDGEWRVGIYHYSTVDRAGTGQLVTTDTTDATAEDYQKTLDKIGAVSYQHAESMRRDIQSSKNEVRQKALEQLFDMVRYYDADDFKLDGEVKTQRASLRRDAWLGGSRFCDPATEAWILIEGHGTKDERRVKKALQQCTEYISSGIEEHYSKAAGYMARLKSARRA